MSLLSLTVTTKEVRLPNSSRDVLFRRLYLLDKHLLADWVNRLILELLADFLPTEILPRPPARCFETFPGGTARTMALRWTRGRSGAVVSLMNRLASALGLPDSEAACGPRTA